MLSEDQTDDQPERSESGAGTSAALPEAPAAPVVTRRTRKAPAKKAAAAPGAPADAADVTEPGAGEPAAPAKKAPAKKAAARKAAPRRSAAKKAAAAPGSDATTPAADTTPTADATADAPVEPAAPAKKAAARKTAARKAPAKKTAAKATAEPAVEDSAADATADAAAHAVLFQAPVVTTTTRRTRKKPTPVPVETAPAEDEAAAPESAAPESAAVDVAGDEVVPATTARTRGGASKKAAAKKTAGKRAAAKKAGGRGAAAPDDDAVAAEGLAEDEVTEETEETAETAEQSAEQSAEETAAADAGETGADAETDTETDADSEPEDDTDGEGGPARRRRRRGGRRRRKGSESGADGSEQGAESAPSDSGEESEAEGESGTADGSSSEGNGEANGEGTSRRRRRRRRAGEESSSDADDPNTVTRVRKGRSAEDQITSVQGSTRLEAKKQRRREGREAGRRRAPIVSEAEFLARRESVERVMVIRQREDLIQIGVLEDKVLVEHYVARESQTSLIGNVYLGRVQNVLPSMEAAFIDIGKGRNAVLYAGEVNWQSLGHKEGQPRKIESVLSSGQMILVQVTKDPVGHKGARLTSQVSLAGRFLVYVPDGTTSGISRKLPDTERSRLKALLKEIVPDTAGVIVRTAAEGASEEELTRDVERLKARWEDIEKKATNKGSGPQLLYGEPDLTLKVVRDLFTEDFSKLVIEGDDAWDTVHGYVESVAPDLAERVEKFERGATGGDVFATYRIDEQIQKGLDRKVWLPSGGSLIIDRTEAMTVVDVNTGKFTGSGGNLEETVTKNNLEAAEEIVRQLRLRDIGGIIVVDFIDMVLESNRDLVVRRLVECLGRDRTRHQVAEVTSLGLVQMTRKRIGTGLVEAFSENCEHCHGRGVVIKDQPVDPNAKSSDDGGEGRRGSRRRGRRGSSGDDAGSSNDGSASGNGGANGRAPEPHHAPSPKDVAAMARHEKPADEPADEPTDEPTVSEGAPEPEPPVVEAPAEDAPAEEAPVEEAPVVEVPAVEAAEKAPAEPEKPRVVTRTRRRSASRPAGPPAGVGTVPDSGLVEPGTAAVEQEAEPSGEPASEPASEAPVVEHVPIKKRGSRKR
jgi:ribonuclease E